MLKILNTKNIKFILYFLKIMKWNVSVRKQIIIIMISTDIPLVLAFVWKQQQKAHLCKLYTNK